MNLMSVTFINELILYCGVIILCETDEVIMFM